MIRLAPFTLAFSLLAASALTVACGDDTSGTGGAGGNATGAGNVGGDQPGGNASNGGGGQGSGGGQPQGGAGGGAPGCTALPGPITPVLVTSQFQSSEDIAFDGGGGLVGKKNTDVIRVDASDNATTIATGVPTAYGLRYAANGDLFVALPSAGKLVKIVNGSASDFATGLGSPNGVYVDFDGNVWVTEFSAGRVIKLAPDGTPTTIASQINTPNGVVLDTARSTLFFTSYGLGQLYRVDPAGGTPTLVGELPSAAFDGLVLDACGNVYAVDQLNSQLYRFNLDAAGTLIGEVELIADFPANVANAQFGSGPGWNATSLYAAGNPGQVFEIPIGVEGAPVPAPN